ncbi:hypothetical protein FUA23_06345 [Neolewinella aurantiaca]|uniref:LTD domain-containing protein n=1 Tax=Neolewinella aurantiaca TaxID=2602767 RepID=A0A5C7FGL3_9BACT|nr:lamin tail domain-containing protein [Neolewinella aurantiaca]TXF90407.1 hypothetical protein FUA23_06345 [Neolewinella aurantiaca]
MKLRLPFLSLLLTFLCTCVSAQTTADTFEDGDLLNPTWTGDNANFVVADGRLQLMAPDAGTSELGVATPINYDAPTTVYEFLVQMDFAPSASNFSTVTLIEARALPEVRQVEMKFGGISGSDDRLEVSFVVGGTEVATMEGTLGALGSNPAIARFRMEHAGNTWTLSADYTGGTNFVLQDQTTVDMAISPDSLALSARYTATRSDLMSWDDLLVTSEVAVDETAPVLISSTLTNPDEITLIFDEVIAQTPAGSPANYSLSATGLSVNSVLVDGATVTLSLSDELPDGEDVTLTVSTITDESGNILSDLSLSFRYDITATPTSRNVVINEFMADPNPVVALPNQEYLELYNPTDTVVDLTGLEIASGGSPVTLPEGSRLAARGYVVITGNEEADGFRALGAAVIEASLPTLSNAGDEISVGYQGQNIQTINYTDDWYNDTERDEGGYSIEFIGEGADAGCSASWRASLALEGGTPGNVNSVLGMSSDVTAPGIAEIEVGDFGITLTFDEAIDISDFTVDLFSFSPAIEFFRPASISDNSFFLSADLEENTVYTLTILPDFMDCAGNAPSEAIVLTVAIPTVPLPGDVVINEILFNPATGGSDFVELYNCSDKVFQIEGWLITNLLSSSSTATQEITTSRLFLPGDYLTFTPDREDILARFQDVNPELLIEQRLPTLSDDEGNVTIDAGIVRLDAFDYTEDFHSELLSPDDGVSLERLRQKSTTQDGSNWFSAASTEGFGTPTRENSQARSGLEPAGEETFSIVNPTFSPNGDSFEDFLELSYTTDRTGFLARVRIFDAQGRPIRTLRLTELLGGTGTLRWDGDNDEGQKAKAGLYVLFVELFNPDGEVREEKLVGVLAGER